ncbi:hypothetical protein BN7_924 [Wickerhamomyces ciferrii]|uniref:Arrestin C-terminal-like domain-containing protein n=1 Tax=Wickerhamomyces ciferrii (strain ATCC 14091 / BCRC 22168 / CBS 111 / JCM 3599 / NBRC 0793 / NRRL Y-1031 F-60-10) TaxID=1206466 RepID=K0KJU8_WICCF|nr:uncharacterized protein BN7_924 [Wickerhamomyces ciferrii]CCH41383.1 hypothetical protein BN7_924 [Wickerhamomyces ciferrii]
MVLLGRNNNPSKQTSLFDIRLKGADHDVLVIKGSPHEASSVFLNGTIVLSVLEPLSIKKLSLKLYATLRLKWTNSYETQRGSVLKKPYRYEKRIFEHSWDSYEFQQYFNNLYDNYNNSNRSPMLTRKNSSANSSSSSLKSYGKKSKSSTNLASFGSSTSLSSSQNSYTLVQGNYEFPFSAVLPGDIIESVEGLPGATVVYKLQANIDRGRFSNDLISKKHVRVVRTLTPDSVELSETMAVDNTWPKKVEYTISIPSRAVAIGSSCPIHMLLVPLAKGLKLGKVKVTLSEYYSCAGSYGPPHSGERTIHEIVVPSTNQEITEDKWEINSHIPIPASLSKCTQDVDVQNNIKVRHKLKFVVGLINPDGHVSELRASLPLILFISPFVALGVKNVERERKLSIASDGSNSFADIPSDHEEFDDNDVIFAPDPETTPANLSSTNLTTDAERMAPPNYENHIYDKLWNEIPIEDTPHGSGSVTPGTGTPNGINTSESLSDTGGMGKLTENLRKLHLQRQAEMTSQPSLDSLARSSAPGSSDIGLSNNNNTVPIIQEDDDDNEGGLSFSASGGRSRNNAIQTPVNELSLSQTPTGALSETDYFSIRPHKNNGIISPGVHSPDHISRVNSDTNLPGSVRSGSPSIKDWDSSSLSQVPSYQTAMRSFTPDNLSPAYVPPDYEDPEVTRPRAIHLKSSSLSNSRAQSTALLSNLRGDGSGINSGLQSANNNDRSRNSSNASSPSVSRNASQTHLPSSSASNNSNPLNYSRSPSKNRYLSSSNFGSLTPLSPSTPPVRPHSTSPSESSPTIPTHVSVGGLQQHNKSASFVNLMGTLLHRKDSKRNTKE